MNSEEHKSVALYIHIPFCRARCIYCAFPSRPGGPATQTAYIEFLSKEIEKHFANNPGWRVSTVFIGGGTPSILAPSDLKHLFKTIQLVAPYAEEITIEANPFVDDLHKPALLKDLGVDRISIGVQSFDDTELGLSGRLHSVEDSERFINACKEAGFTNISFDLIYGLPNQTLLSFESSLKKAVSWAPQHISLYGLSIEPESRLGRFTEREIEDIKIPDCDTQAEMYELARGILADAGFLQYEISNFSKQGFHCRHNLAYWSGQEYIGFGPGAASFIDGTRYKRIQNVDTFLAVQRQGKNTIEYLENLSSERAAIEAFILGLRKSEGISRKNLETRYGVKLSDLCGEALMRYRDEGLIEMDEDNIRLSGQAYFLSNSIFRDLVL